MTKKNETRDNQTLSRRKAMLRIAANVSKVAAVTVVGAAAFTPARAYSEYVSGGNIYVSTSSGSYTSGGAYASNLWGYSAYSDSVPYVNSAKPVN